MRSVRLWHRLRFLVDAAVLLALTLGGARAVHAQDSTAAPPVSRGARVRISESDASGLRVRVGTVVSKTNESLLLQFDSKDEAVPIAWTGITRLEVLRSSASHAKAGVGIGFVVGAGVGMGFFHILCDPVGGDSDCGKGRLFGALAGSAVGAVIGGVIGSVAPTRLWEPIAASQWRVSVGPMRGGVGLYAMRPF